MYGEKKFKFEVSKLGLLFIVLFALCILIWTFILGVWIGTKIGEKPQFETVKLEPQPAQTPQVSPVKEVAHSENQTNQALGGNQTTPQQVAFQVQPEQQTKPEVKVEKEKPTPEPKTEKVKTEPVRTAKVPPQEKVKPQPHQEGMPFYALQVGAYSNKESAEKVKAEVEKMGFRALIKESIHDGKPIYKVLAGRFENREKAEQYKTMIEATLGVRPFVVEVR
ncbi:MAG: SPOR domain-containing protein [Thermodesulfobacteriaceae bacterium]|jgi:cell division septation protein DedD